MYTYTSPSPIALPRKAYIKQHLLLYIQPSFAFQLNPCAIDERIHSFHMASLRTSYILVLWLSFALTFLLHGCLSVEIDREGLPWTGLNTTDWETGVLPPLDQMWELNDFQIAAKNFLAARWYGMSAHALVPFRRSLNYLF